MKHSLIEYAACEHCHKLTDTDEQAACDFAGCSHDYLCPDCTATLDGRTLCLHHYDVLEAAAEAAEFEFAEVA